MGRFFRLRGRLASADDLGAREEVGDLDGRVLRRVGAVHQVASIDSAKSLRIVPASALAGLVAPMISRFFATAFSPSRT